MSRPKPKAAKIPPAQALPAQPDPSPTPQQLDEKVIQKEKAKRRQKLVARGRAGTILVEGGLGGEKGKATMLSGAL